DLPVQAHRLKKAMPAPDLSVDGSRRTFYHITRSGNAEKILHEGLDPNHMNPNWQKPKRRRAVFLWGSYESAVNAEYSDAFNGTLDGFYFRVTIPESWVQPDTTYERPDSDEPT